MGLKNLKKPALQMVCYLVIIVIWLVGSIKLQVSLAEYSLFFRALLQKRPTILRSLLIVVWCRVAKTHRMPEVVGHFLQKTH